MRVDVEAGVVSELNAAEMKVVLKALEDHATKVGQRPVPRLRKELREVRDNKILQMSLAKVPVVEIGEEVGLTTGRVCQIISELKKDREK